MIRKLWSPNSMASLPVTTALRPRPFFLLKDCLVSRSPPLEASMATGPEPSSMENSAAFFSSMTGWVLLVSPDFQCAVTVTW